MKETSFIFPENEILIKHLKERQDLFRHHPEKIYPWWRRPCKVKLLLLTDGLDFGPGDFGLSTFVSILANEGRTYVDFEITLGHRGPNVGDPGVPVSASIPNFNFTNAAHFTESKYDQIWFFGANGTPLSNAELLIVGMFMNKGGGVFATGDHGTLGNSLCGAITRVRSMRRWDNASGEVGMNDPRRNDTNRPGHDAGTQFDDQSDDIPQSIQPKLYSGWLSGFWRETYPHPILCSPLGRITVLPDHPHEGECIEPSDLTQIYLDGSQEYPAGAAPEIIAKSSVLSGSTGGTKQATQFQVFGAICAYDGHRANVGRVVTDATWHHFINVNLVGELFDYEGNRGTTEHASKLNGFLSSVSGQNHFSQIKHYFINIGVWISRKSNHTCFNSRLLWNLVFQHRVMEATMDNATLKFELISPALLYSIGTHATDVIGKKASQCRKLRLMLELFAPIWPEYMQLIDPWNPKPNPNPPIPWYDFNPLLAMGMGGGLIAMRDRFAGAALKDAARITEKEIIEVFQAGAQKGLEVAKKEVNSQLKKFTSFN